MNTKSDISKRFWSKVDIRGPEDCWPWRVARNRYGYGRIWINGKEKKAHRVAYELYNDPIPNGLQVLHDCDNPRCVNPSHLHLGTHADNMREKAVRGRCRGAAGSANRHAKLVEAQVKEIRAKYAKGDTSHAKLATAYGVVRGHIGRIVSGNRWKTCS